MKTICPICKSNFNSTVAELNKDNKARFVKYDSEKYDGYLSQLIEDAPPVIKSCNECGHCWYQYQPNQAQLIRMYEISKPLTKKNINIDKNLNTKIEKKIKILREIERKLNGSEKPKFLDFGSGFGRWSLAAVNAGFEVTSYEPSDKRSKNSNIGYDLINNFNEIKDIKFDIILMEQVLEHVSDPVAILKQITRNCHEKTIVKISVPNMRRNKFGKRVWEVWPYDGLSPHILAPYEHLHGFTPESLNKMIKSTGFENINAFTEIKYAKEIFFRRKIGIIFSILSNTERFVKIKL